MSGLLLVLLLAFLALGVMRVAGLRGGMLTFAAAALMVGAAGYALGGRPGLAGSPRAERATSAAPISLAAVRLLFFGNFNGSDHWLMLADSLARRGKTQDAVGILQSGVRAHPRDYTLWVGLGNALTDHARGITPAARFAFAHAREIAPQSPAPDYFEGLALLRSGDPATALALWRAVLERTPQNAQYRPLVADGVGLIERMAAAPAR
ncbi:tetratricopeptide repeat protein [Sphingomonas mesophila]|uniref:tetratricopeptide repeat protein n=1 Tax=Sphingomonas mesophila TaxID=2303576 RepID=UPI000E57C64E|nr:tetratricopeptide repeat protein [Sphingomonas mesophila]